MLKLVRMTIWNILLVILALCVIPLCIVRPFNSDNGTIWAKVLQFLSMPLLGLKLKVYGKDRLNSGKNRSPKGVLYISNHQHNMDIFLYGALSGGNSVSIGKRELLFVPVFGLMYWLSDQLLINRGDKTKARGTMEQARHRLYEKGQNIWILPEGTRSHGKGLGPFKKGAFHLAQQTKAKIIPVVASSFSNIDFNRPDAGSIYISVGKPIELIEGESTEELTLRARSVVEKEITRLDALIESDRSQA